jgi:hypothetical protein
MDKEVKESWELEIGGDCDAVSDCRNFFENSL